MTFALGAGTGFVFGLLAAGILVVFWFDQWFGGPGGGRKGG